MSKIPVGPYPTYTKEHDAPTYYPPVSLNANIENSNRGGGPLRSSMS